MKKLAMGAAFVAALCACTPYRPIIDLKNVEDRNKYEQDLAECQAYAEQAPPSRATNALAKGLIGALAGGALGAAGGAIAGNPKKGAVIGAAAGAGAGVLYGAAEPPDGPGYGEVFQNCMEGRGYKVLG